MVLSLRPLVAEAGLLEQTAGAVVQEGARGPLAARVLRIRLDHPAAGLCDQVQGSPKRHGGDALAPVVPVDEEAGEAVIGRLIEARGVLLQVVDVGKLSRRTVLAPADRDRTVEDHGRVSVACANQTLLDGAVPLRAFPLLGARGMEPRAPATAPHAIVFVRQPDEGVPGRRTEWRHFVPGQRSHSAQRQNGCPAGSRNTRKVMPGWYSCLVAPSSITAASAASRSSTTTSRCIC